MALIFIEGFDNIDTAQIARKWETVVGNGVILTPGRFGGKCLQFNNVGTTSYVQQSFVARQSYIFGSAFSIAYGDSTGPIITYLDDGTPQLDVRITADAAIQFTRNGVPIATSDPNRFAFGFFNYLEVQVFISNLSGYVIARINGNVVLNVSGLDTQNTGNSTINQIRFSPPTNSGNYDLRFDDLYICDTTGIRNNTFLGETRVETHFPVANGSTNNFVVYGADNNWQAVDETTADDDASFTQSGTIGAKDLYQIEDHNFTGEIFGVQQVFVHRKDDVGERNVAALLKTGNGTEYEGSQIAAQSSYQLSKKLWEVNPETGTEWTPETVNASEFGIIVKG